MSRLPPVPPASKPVHGPEGVAKTSIDVSHRVRHRAQRAAASLDHEGGTIESRRPSGPSGSPWLLVAAAAALGLGYCVGRRVA